MRTKNTVRLEMVRCLVARFAIVPLCFETDSSVLARLLEPPKNKATICQVQSV